MLEKLKELALRYEDLQAQLADPSVYGDAERLKTVNRELKDLTPVAEAYQAYRQAEADRAAAEELLSDPEMRELAQEELTAAREEMERLRQELKLLLLPKDPNDRKNVILEIETKGAMEVMRKAEDVCSIYLLPPTMRVLRDRLVSRGREGYEKAMERFRCAYDEIDLARAYRYVIVNEKLEDTVQSIEDILHGEYQNPADLEERIKTLKEETEL